MADDRVEQEIRAQSRTWWETMVDNLSKFRDWLKKIVDTYKLGSDIMAATSRYIDFIKKLLGRK
jgi:hypothetical protein